MVSGRLFGVDFLINPEREIMNLLEGTELSLGELKLMGSADKGKTFSGLVEVI